MKGKVVHRLFIVFIGLLLGCLQLQGQMHNPVSWSGKIEEVAGDTVALYMTAKIEDGWTMYAMGEIKNGPTPVQFAISGSDAYELVGEVEELTKPTVKNDPFFDNQAIGKHKVKAEFRQRLVVKQTEGNVQATATYMCCDDNSCLPPMDAVIKVSLQSGAVVDTPKSEGGEASPAPLKTLGSNPFGTVNSTEAVVEKAISDSAAAEEDNEGVWAFFFMAILAGLGGVLTPCVYPMIPMTVSFFMKEGESRAKSIRKAIVFGVSVILIYTLIGLIVALTKRADAINIIVSHWITNLVFAAVFIVFALSFFGLFEISLPNSWANKIDKKSEGSGLLSTFFMALALVVVSFSCTGPFVGSILVASAQGLAIKPLMGMFGFGLAFALPFTLLACFPSLMKKLPKSGGWMNTIKVVFAFVMLAFALYFLSYMDQGLGLHLFTRDVFLSIWIVLFVMCGMYILGKIRFAHDMAVETISVGRFFFASASFVFALYLFTGLLGAPLNSVAGLLPVDRSARQIGGTKEVSMVLCDTPKYADSPSLGFPYGLKGYFDYEQALSCAKDQNKPLLMVFKGHACAKCKEMEATIWQDPEVLSLLSERFVLLALYTDDKTPLLEGDVITSQRDGQVKTTIGAKNLDFEISQFATNAFPFHVIQSGDGVQLGESFGYTADAGEFAAWLKSGL